MRLVNKVLVIVFLVKLVTMVPRAITPAVIVMMVFANSLQANVKVYISILHYGFFSPIQLKTFIAKK
jgi:hypothetical protein